MEDTKIVELYWKRSEDAILETSKKYSRYCISISFNILQNNEDAEECTNETYFRAWNTIPPKRPDYLAAFLGRITRNLSLDIYRKYSAKKRGLCQRELVLSELDEIIDSSQSIEQELGEIELIDAINNFLNSLPSQKRIIFVQRYWYLLPVKSIAEYLDLSESQVRVTLYRTRLMMKTYLDRRGIVI